MSDRYRGCHRPVARRPPAISADRLGRALPECVPPFSVGDDDRGDAPRLHVQDSSPCVGVVVAAQAFGPPASHHCTGLGNQLCRQRRTLKKACGNGVMSVKAALYDDGLLGARLAPASQCA